MTDIDKHRRPARLPDDSRGGRRARGRQDARRQPGPPILTAFVVVVSVLATAWILVWTHHGARVTADSAAYLSVAENLASGKGLVDFQGKGLYWFPPGYSISLAGFELVGIDAQQGGRFLNAALFAMTILVSGLWLKTVCRSAWVVAAGVLTIACSRTLQAEAATLHSEGLYLLLTVGSLIGVSAALENAEPDRRRRWLLLGAGLLAGLSAVTRYVGVVALASSVAVILAWRASGVSLRGRVRAAALFGAAGSLPLLAVLARNVVHTGALLGDRLDHSTGHSVLDGIGILMGLLVGIHGAYNPAFAIPWVMLLAALVICSTAAGETPPPQAPASRLAGLGLSRLRLCRSVPFAVFAVAYCVALVVTQPLNSGPVVGRLFLPAALASVFVGCEALDKALGLRDEARQPRAGPGRGLVPVGAGVAIALGLAASLQFGISEGADAFGLGHADGGIVDGLVESPMIDHLRRHGVDGDLHSNRPAGIYLLTGIQPVRRLPARPAEPETGAACLDLLAGDADDDHESRIEALRIAWFDEPKPADLRSYCDIPGIAQRSGVLEPVTEFADGAIYRYDPSG